MSRNELRILAKDGINQPYLRNVAPERAKSPPMLVKVQFLAADIPITNQKVTEYSDL